MNRSISSGLLKIFDTIKERKLMIVFDTSGSMYHKLDLTKTCIFKLVHYLSHVSKKSQFNVVAFSQNNNIFSESLVPCAKENLSLISSWLSSLQCESQTNTLLALVSAFSNENADGVVVFSDGVPNQKASSVLKCIEGMCQGRPLHAVYVNNGTIDPYVVKFWQKLSSVTNGTVHVLSSKHQNQVQHSQIYPRQDRSIDDNLSDDSSSTSSNDSSKIAEALYNKECSFDSKLENRPKMKTGWKHLNHKQKVLAKYRDGFFYTGELIKEISSKIVLVAFLDGKKKPREVKSEDAFYYDNVTGDTIHEGDYVLAKDFNSEKFVPAKVLQKDYNFDPTDDDLEFTKSLTVSLYNGRRGVIDGDSAIRISHEYYDEITRDIFQREKHNQIKEDAKRIDLIDEFRNGFDFDLSSYDFAMQKREARRMSKISSKRDHLREKIEQQLAESADFLQNLGLDDYTEALREYSSERDPDIVVERDSIAENQYRRRRFRKTKLSHSLNIPMKTRHDRGDSSSEDNNTSLMNSYPLKKQPRPPPSWQSADSGKGKRRQRKYHRSPSVGSNIVERSKKHWTGRPIGKEIFPKRPFNEKVRVIPSMKNPPQAEEYQTTDGVPFPTKTDIKLYHHPQVSGNWSPGCRPIEGYQHRDIIGHRVVEFQTARAVIPDEASRAHDRKKEIREKNELNALQDNRAIRERQEQARKKVRDKQLQERDEQARQVKQQRKEDGYTKVKITIEKDRSSLKSKKQQYETWRRFEKEREQRNQNKKHERIDAMKERKLEYPQLSEENKRAQVKVHKPHTREEKRTAAEQIRIDQQIDEQQAKLNRLKQLRKATDARFDALRKGNDRHRDINNHVKDLHQGRVRAEILP